MFTPSNWKRRASKAMGDKKIINILRRRWLMYPLFSPLSSIFRLLSHTLHENLIIKNVSWWGLCYENKIMCYVSSPFYFLLQKILIESDGYTIIIYKQTSFRGFCFDLRKQHNIGSLSRIKKEKYYFYLRLCKRGVKWWRNNLLCDSVLPYGKHLVNSICGHSSSILW